MKEPLEGALRARFGQMVLALALLALIEPLEGALRAQFGQMVLALVLLALIEPLEGALRARFGQIGRCDTLSSLFVFHLSHSHIYV